MKTLFLFFIILFTTSVGYSQDLVYTPKNPAFGGDTFGYQWLLSGANAQNDFREETEFEQDSELERFTQQLNQQLLNSVSRQLFQDTFGEDGLQVGTYTFGSLSVEISPSSQGLSINVLDTSTGETSLIIIPYY